MQNFKETQTLLKENIAIEITADGSPTLRPVDGESMHHSAGAASETEYIYGFAIDKWIEFQKLEGKKIETESGAILVVGFGLGYIEILMAIKWCFIYKLPKQNLSISSYEKINIYYELFNRWLTTNLTQTDSIYDQIVRVLISLFGKDYEWIQVADVKDVLLGWLDSGTWKQKGELDRSEFNEDGYQIIQYDAYSSKTNSELWSPELLKKILINQKESNVVFSTYACTGVLKKVANDVGWSFSKRDGFKGKRNSTFISKALFNV